MQIIRWAGAAVLGAGLALALATPGYADHAAPELTAGEPGECGTLTVGTGEWLADTHQVATTVLVVQAASEQTVAAVGETVTVGPFDVAEVTVRWRVWGGGERDYDSPALDDLQALLDYLEANPGGELDADPPGVAWHELTVEGCEPEPTPSPSAEPSPEPSPSAPPAGGTVGGDEAQLPKTGVPTGLIAAGGAAVAAVGGGVVWLARRSRVTFTA